MVAHATQFHETLLQLVPGLLALLLVLHDLLLWVLCSSYVNYTTVVLCCLSCYILLYLAGLGRKGLCTELGLRPKIHRHMNAFTILYSI